ncbi:D-alanine--D-alanine ligase [Rickettsiales endosymbiont of Peranema trichophorum]|uniref:D-alanine--D-alanine ligase n=1 Tax=Rickettsiales endosymbiont of Peranema trichophorum TaxID=2486577 RepID=UPI0010236FC8|nr:D-alanine--D-alanine ligase [Rickettsiales endosymbiont of Peranema trichophorum]RZI47690.1 D-alanine--D-alanine ligase [Rickettsiales endosymbiont of Peranema trichophorum]
MKHVVVLMGGSSTEAEVSVVSGTRVASVLRELGYTVTVVEPDKNLALRLAELSPNVVFNALHGTYGEDGAVQGLLEIMRIPYTHSGITSSAIAFNKIMTKQIASQLNIQTPHHKIVQKEALVDLITNGEHPMPLPYVIKPISDGSSIGVQIVYDISDVDVNALCRDQFLLETYIPGKELSVAVFKNEALGVLELSYKDRFADYNAKYAEGGSTHIIPASISKEIYDKVAKQSTALHQALGCSVISRSDFKFDESKGADGLYFLEINTQPGLTFTSMVPDLLAYAGYELKDLIKELIAQAKCHISV